MPFMLDIFTGPAGFLELGFLVFVSGSLVFETEYRECVRSFKMDSFLVFFHP